MNFPTKPQLTRAPRRAQLSLLSLSLLGLSGASLTSCRQRGVCDDVVGSCLALQVTGPGPFAELRTTLELDTGSSRSGTTQGDVQLPLTLRVVPPAGVLSDSVRAVAVAGVQAGNVTASGRTDPTFSWPDGEHIEAALVLSGQDQPPTDGGVPTDLPDMTMPPGDMAMPPGDMAMPLPPTLKWMAETNTGGRQELYDVWTGSGTQAWAVGQGGTILSRQATGSWTTESAGTTQDLYSIYGLSGSSVWATGANPGAWRRDNGTGKWAEDRMGLALTPQASVWSVTTGATPGELWAGSNDGKVWQRTGAANTNGTWAAEQALPAGNIVYSVAYADGVVFAVGERGYVAVRTGTKWSTPYQYSALAGSTMGRSDALYGVWAADKNTAFAVGSHGLLVRYSSGIWQTMPQKIDDQANELNGIWGTSASRIWAVGYNGLIIRVDGTTANVLRRDTSQNLFGIFGRSESDIFAVGVGAGGQSLILHGTP